MELYLWPRNLVAWRRFRKISLKRWRVLKFVDEVYNSKKVEKFIAIAGTPTTIASLKLGFTYKIYDPNKIHGRFYQ